jgi:hypothetical protein
MTITKLNPAKRFLIYALPLSLFIAAWWDCGASALANVFAEPVAARVVGWETITTRSKSGTRTLTRANFRFTVNGVSYSGDNVSCCDGLLKLSGVDSGIRKTSEDLRTKDVKQLTVWVNPSYPQHAVLMRDMPHAAICVFVFSLFLTYSFSKLLIFVMEQGRWPEKFEKI